MAKAKTSRKPKAPRIEPKPIRMQKAPAPRPIQTYAELGAFFAEQRKEAKLTMQKVSEDTRIRLQYIKDIERGDFGRLPADIYTRAYLKSYAKCVGADAVKVLELYESIGKGISTENIEPKQEKSQEKVKALPQQDDESKPGMRLVIITLAAAAIAYGIWYNFRLKEIPAPIVVPAETAIKQPESIAHEIVLLALKDTEVKITVEGKEGMRKLTAGETFALPDVITQVTLEASDPTALEIYLDGEAVPTPAPSGDNGKYIVIDVSTPKSAPDAH